MKLLVLCSVLKNVLHVAGSGSAFNTLANAILILKVNGIHTVCKPLEPDVYDVPHCRLIHQQWGIFNAIVKQNTLTSEYITYPITHNRCALPYGVLNGYNTNSGSTCLTLEASTLEHFKWVIGTTSSVEIVNYNRWFSIGM